MNEIKQMKIDDEVFPLSLLRYKDSPKLLYYLSDNNINLNNYTKKVAIVGARDASKYALDTAYKIAYELSKEGVVIVSGLAKGVDAQAHKGALDANGVTAAILGNGLNTIYPTCNENIFNEIRKSGIVLSEYPSDMPPLKQNFPARNRIICGLCDFVLVVEAKQRSGSLITARIALDYGIDVGVIPGNIYCSYAQGSNLLLRDGAYPILETRDILELL
ncbi:MAG: DNA-processing protein DprA [Clostridia bacterium]|nr:DNA-processing protein DprA [Clostridia bacterium]